LTSTVESVPLAWKFMLTSAPAATLPLPVTVDWTIPFAAVTICVEVRAELVGAPISATARTAMATAATESAYRYHGRFWRLRMARPPVVDMRTRVRLPVRPRVTCPTHQAVNFADRPERYLRRS
jgi:hypothetical protein